MTIAARLLRILTIAVLCAFACGAPVGAEELKVVDTGTFTGSVLDLLPQFQAAQSTAAQIAVPLPPDDRGGRAQMPLEASRTDRARHDWRILHLANPRTTPDDLLLVVPHRQFSGSGLFWPSPSGSQVASFQLSTAELVRPIRTPAADVLAMTLSPKSALTYALELNGSSLSEAWLYKRSAWDAKNLSRVFFNGMVLGIGILLTLAAAALFAVRRRAPFAAATLFIGAATAFLALSMGYLMPVAALFQSFPLPLDMLRVLIEGLLTIGTILALLTFLELPRRKPAGAAAAYVGLGMAGMLMLYGLLFSPLVAIGLLRVLFALVVAVGAGLSVTMWSNSVRTQATGLVWGLLALWTMIAAADCAGLLPGETISPLTAAMLVLVMLAMTVAISQFGFGPQLSARRSMDEIARRALALANSEQSVWDWQIDRRALIVGAELERALGLKTGTIAKGGIEAWNEVIHPADRSATIAALDAARLRKRGSLTMEFRLRRADGSYRWYNLRGRVIPGEAGDAERIVGAIADVTAMRRAEDRLLFDAVRDRITALPNRPLFLDRLERAMRVSPRGLWCVVIDIDRFKNVNDTLGHEVGDSLLHVTARRLSTLTGPDDTLARLTGDQFGLVFHGERGRDIDDLSQEVRALISQPVKIRGQEIFLTASVGAAPNDHGRTTAEDLLRDAEIALYEAKRHGKDMTEVFRPEMREQRFSLASMEQDLLQAVEKNEIDVVYQPIVRISDGQLAGFEALARWRRPSGEVVEPSRFIAVAEETGAIRAVGRHVLSEAARQLGVWQRAFRPSDPLFVAVNVSSRQLIGNELVDDLKAIMAREDLKPGTLKIEITETLVMQNPELSGRVLDRIRSLGVGLACDDFGTGYSSLANLRRLPFDTLKIDRGFIDVDPDDEQAAIILESIILLAHDLNLTVVAEGVENANQMGRLIEFECDFAQGFHIGEPATAAQVTEALGGVPYHAGVTRNGFGKFWDRLIGKPPVFEPIPVPPPPMPSPHAPLPEPEPADTAYAPPAAAYTRPRFTAPEPARPTGVPVGAAPFAPRRAPRLPPLDAVSRPDLDESYANETVAAEEPVAMPVEPEVEPVAVESPEVEANTEPAVAPPETAEAAARVPRRSTKAKRLKSKLKAKKKPAPAK
ncbi:MAG: EAL domain-containing protein [Hyphomicrobiales bacterium]